MKKDLQKLIVEKHLADDFPLLIKYPTSLIGSGVDFFYSNYDLVGLVSFDRPEEQKYLPHFEFNVATHYSIKVPDDLMSENSSIEYIDDSIHTFFKSKYDKSPVKVVFPTIEDLFQLRNLKSEGKILTLFQVKEEDIGKLPINEEDIKLGFTFRASSTTFGQLYGHMDISHPGAEELIKEYLETIDRRFADYTELKKYFREKDDEGNILWQDQGLQSKAYNLKRRKLHKALFGDLKKVLKKGDVRIEDSTYTPALFVKHLRYFFSKRRA